MNKKIEIKLSNGAVKLDVNNVLDAMKEAGYIVTQNYQAWQPEIGEYYEHVASDGSIQKSTWANDGYDLNRLAFGSAHPISTGQAEKESERQKATVRVLSRYRELEALDADFDALYWGDSRQGKAYAAYNHSIGLLKADVRSYVQDRPSEYYSTQEIIEQVNGELKRDVKMMIGVCGE